MTVDTLDADLLALGVEATFHRDGTMTVSANADDATREWLKANREAVRKRWSPYLLVVYRLPTPGMQVYRPMGVPSDPPPCVATGWRWAQEAEWEGLPG